MDLKIGRIDALAVDELVGRYYLSQKPGEYSVLSEVPPLRAHRHRHQEGRRCLEDKIQKTLDAHVQGRHHEEDIHQVVRG